MRSVLAGTIGLSLGLGGAFAQSPGPAAGLGRPVPAASLGRPTPLAGAPDSQPFQPASYNAERPLYPARAARDTAPMLAPVGGTAADEPPVARPMPGDGGPGSVVAPLPGYAPAPSYGPVPAPVPVAPGNCPPGGCAPQGLTFLGQPGCDFGPCVAAAGGGRFYTSVDFLMLWVPDITTPLPVAMVSPNAFPPDAPFPADSTVAIGRTDLISNFRLGARVNAGFWCDPCHLRGLDFGFFFAGPASRTLVAATNGERSLFRPYVVINQPDPATGTPEPVPGRPNFADVVADLGDTGFIRTRTDSFLMGADANFRRRLIDSCCNYVDLLLGFRYMRLDESLVITESGTRDGDTFTLTDRFRTVNNFYGGQIGAVIHKEWGRWSADLTLKLGLGPTVSTVYVSGSNNFADNPNIGLFAGESNIGRWTSSAFSVVPEVGLNLGYQLTPRLRVHVGYTGLYWSNVLKPGDQIDPIIDQSRVPIPPGSPVPGYLPLHPSDPHPAIPFRRSDYWAQGINLGLTLRW